MGLSDLVLVSPRDPNGLFHPDAIALATGAADLLEHARIKPSLVAALSDCQFALAMTARNRDLSPTELTPRLAAAQIAKYVHSKVRCAIVFGNERYGLDNADVLACQASCTIPTSPTYSSLNLSQAVQIMAYECRLAVLEGAPPIEQEQEPLASVSEREQLFEHLNEALTAIGFLNPEHPKRLAQRIRRMFSRTNLEVDEVNILRGICTAILQPRR
jgi:tRNA/rRNA methyltransferase